MKLLFCTFLIIGSLVGRSASAATFYVGTNGDDSNSCTQAQDPATPKRNIIGGSGGLSCLGAGNADVLDIRSGSYSDRITSIVSGSSFENAATLRAHTGESVTITGGIALESTSYVIFEGFHITTSALWVGSTFQDGSNSAHHIRFVNLDVGPVYDSHLLLVNQWGHHVEVLGGNWHDAPYGTAECNGSGTLACYAFYIVGQNNLIEHTKIYDNPSYGIHNYSGDAQKPNQNVYRFNEIYNNGNNPVSSQTSAGLLLASGNGDQAYGNIVRDNYAAGIGTGPNATNSLIYNNTVYNNDRNNTGFGGISWSTGSGTIIKNNIVYQNDGNDFYDAAGAETPEFANNHCTNSGPGCAQFGDPLFADVGNNNFTLLIGSPARGAGTPNISGDISLGFVPDIGAMLDLQP